MIYIGSTCQTLSQRMALHRYDSIKPNKQKTKIYKEMIDNGRNNYYIEPTEDYTCENTYQLRKREGELIRELKPSLNINIPSRTNKEYRQEEAQKVKAAKAISDAKYREENYETIKQKKHEYNQKNKEQIKIKRRHTVKQTQNNLNKRKKNTSKETPNKSNRRKENTI